jgi:uncharacterized membrane protein YfcA
MIWAWIGALFIGISLGLLGSGGSILTVPVLVYLVGEPEKVAIAESLGIVGAVSLVGFIPYALKKNVHWKSVVYFGIPGMAGTYGGAYLAGFVSGSLQLIVFAVVMIMAAVMMFRDGHRLPEGELPYKRNVWIIALEGIAVGILTGFVGVGGGFVIVPALVLLGGLPIHLAVGTSLAIIAMKSFAGFYKYIEVLDALNLSMNWSLILIFSGIGVTGTYIGRKAGGYLSQGKLKKGFAFFLIVMAAYIMILNV